VYFNKRKSVWLRNFGKYFLNFKTLQKKFGLGSDMSEKIPLKTLALQSAQGHPLTRLESPAQRGVTLL
jgi:hypothetical protein